MTADEEIQQFVRASLDRGLERPRIESVLREAGWRPDQIRRALAGYAEVEFPLPVPRPRPYLSAREAFVYLVLFTTLYVSAISLGGMFFQFIDRAVPDPSDKFNEEEFRNAVRWSVANLIVTFPVFLSLTIAMQRAITRDPTKRSSRVRKWLTYQTLYVGAAILIGDLVALVHGFLAGDLTRRFVLKALVVAVIAGTAFGYYLWDLRQDEGESGP